MAAIAAAVLAVSLFWTVAAIDVPHDVSDQEAGRLVAGLGEPDVRPGLRECPRSSSPCPSRSWRTTSSASKRRHRAPQWLAFARSMAAAVTAVWLVTGAARATVGHLVDTMDEAAARRWTCCGSPTGFNYTLLGLAGMGVLASCMLALSVVVLRTGVFGRWLAYVGLCFSVLMLGAVGGPVRRLHHAAGDPVVALPGRGHLARTEPVSG